MLRGERRSVVFEIASGSAAELDRKRLNMLLAAGLAPTIMLFR
jgi:hypothetical protein